jgi:hypothetical protein
MPKCKACGNAEVFWEANVELAKWFYDEEGDSVDQEFSMYGERVSRNCGKCDSTDIEE